MENSKENMHFYIRAGRVNDKLCSAAMLPDQLITNKATQSDCSKQEIPISDYLRQ